MGKVVKLDGPARQRTSARRRSRGRRRARTALVLGGGGFTGAVYEIGALRALDLLSVNKSVNDFDVYVGTSAGALIAALAANGVTPDEMMRVIEDRDPSPFRALEPDTLLRPNHRGWLTTGVRLPLHLAGLVRRVAATRGSFSGVDLAAALAAALPSGLYSGAGIEEYLAGLLAEPGRTDDFGALGCELYLAATDLDTCERIVFGADGWADVPISTAVRASTALPMVYAPVRVKDRELVDGGVVSTTNLDIAVHAGAELIVVVNPLVPYVNDAGERRVSEMGFPQIAYQTFKLLTHQRLHEMARSWEERYPGVDIVLVEPEADDELMFRTSIMDYRSRLEVARHGLRSVTAKLAAEYDELHEVCARHGIEISPARLSDVAERAAPLAQSS